MARHDHVDVDRDGQPSSSPASVPITPTMAPCTTKMPMMLRGLAPRVRRMAMSARLSCTVITKPETRLNAATATMSVRMMNIMRFRVAPHQTSCGLLRPVTDPQVATQAGGQLSATVRLVQVGAVSGGCRWAFGRKMRSASSWCSSTNGRRIRSGPVSKVPTTVICLMPGTTRPA